MAHHISASKTTTGLLYAHSRAVVQQTYLCCPRLVSETIKLFRCRFVMHSVKHTVLFTTNYPSPFVHTSRLSFNFCLVERHARLEPRQKSADGSCLYRWLANSGVYFDHVVKLFVFPSMLIPTRVECTRNSCLYLTNTPVFFFSV